MYIKAWEDNRHFALERRAFDGEYFSFIYRILSQLPAQPMLGKYLLPPYHHLFFSDIVFLPFLIHLHLLSIDYNNNGLDVLAHNLESGFDFYSQLICKAKDRQILPKFMDLLRERYAQHISVSLSAPPSLYYQSISSPFPSRECIMLMWIVFFLSLSYRLPNIYVLN